MKCNRCGKIIPENEEIKEYGSRYDGGGNYHEVCYREKYKESERSFWIGLTVSVVLIIGIAWLVCRTTNKRKKN